MTPTVMDLPEQLEDEQDGKVEELEQAEDDTKRHADEPKANIYGIYVDDVEKIDVPLPKSLKSSVVISVVQASNGAWLSAASVSFPNGGFGSGIKIGSDDHATKLDAIWAGADGVIQSLIAHKDSPAKLREKVEIYQDGIQKEIAASATAGQELGEEIDASFEVTPDKPAKKTAQQKAIDKATKHYETRKRDAEENLSNCVLRRRECEAALKSAKGSEKAAAELLESVLARGVEQLPLFDRPAETSDDKPVDASAADRSTATTADPEAWKSQPISALGLKPALEEKLTSDGIDTIGRLEQRRADISQGKEKWPKGIGKAKITEIEDAVIGWLTENQHQCGQVAEEAAELTDEQLAQLLVDRARAIFTGDADCLEPAGETDAVWDSGVAAFERGLKITDCPYVAGDEQDDWLKGWMSAKETKDGEIVSSDLGDL